MVRVNKKYLNKQLQEEAWNYFLSEIKKCKSPDMLAVSLKKFFTASEIIMLEKRLSIPILMEQKLSYKTIGAILDVSPVTISFVKHNLTKKPAVHRKMTTRQEKKRYHLPSYKGVAPLF